MQLIGRPRAADLAPIAAVAAAAAILLLVALSIVLQPPAAGAAGALDRALSWMRAVLFTAGAATFFLGLVAFARMAPAGDETNEPSTAAPARAETPLRHSARPPAGGGASRASRRSAARIAPPYAEANAASREPSFTLLAIGHDEEDVRAIADYDDADELVSALQAWMRRHPDEELRVFAPGGAVIAHRQPEPTPVPGWEPVAEQQFRRAAVAGGIA